MSYLDRGDRLNMQTLELTPSHEKQAEPVIDPNSQSFEPENDEPIFTTDILGNSTLLDVMRRLMNNREPHAIGLAFDGSAARRGSVPGFEFRLYRDKDTRAWPPARVKISRSPTSTSTSGGSRSPGFSTNRR